MRRRETKWTFNLDLGLLAGIIMVGVGVYKATGSGSWCLAAVGAVLALAPHMGK